MTLDEKEWVNALFFFGQSPFETKNNQKCEHSRLTFIKILKKVKKVCFQNGNTICEHKFQIKKYPVTEKHQNFHDHTLKKKEQKRARAFLADFLKKLFFSTSLFGPKKRDTHIEKHETLTS